MISIAKFFPTFLKRTRLSKSYLLIVTDHCCSEKVVSKSSFIFSQQQLVYKHHQTFNLTQLENQILSV